VGKAEKEEDKGQRLEAENSMRHNRSVQHTHMQIQMWMEDVLMHGGL